MDVRKKLSCDDVPDETLLEDLRRVAQQRGSHFLPKVAYRAFGTYNFSEIEIRFHTWGNAVTMAGLRYMHNGSDITKEDIAADIRRVAEKVSPKRLYRDTYILLGSFRLSHIKRHFRSWSAACRASGLVPVPVAKTDKVDLLADVRRVSVELGKSPLSESDYMKHGTVDVKILKARFRSWRGVLANARLPYIVDSDREQIDVEDVKADLRRVTGMMNRGILTRAFYIEHGKYDLKTVIWFLGSWGSVVRRFRLHAADAPVSIRAEMIKDIRRVTSELKGRNINLELYQSMGRFNSSRIVDVFGSWQKALNEAGMRIRHRHLDLLLMDVAEVWDRSGQAYLTSEEYDRHGSFTSQRLIKSFKKWDEVLRLARFQRANS